MADYDEKYGDDKLCECGHKYFRHFDPFKDMTPVGCKYCECDHYRTTDGTFPRDTIEQRDIDPLSVYDRGLDDGNAEGYKQGFDAGMAAGFEQGKGEGYLQCQKDNKLYQFEEQNNG